MKNDFNAIAPVYDLLAKLVFGKSLENAQLAFLSEIDPKAKVLIVGGGTGKILEWLPEGLALEIDYVELSKGMLDKASSRVSHGNNIQRTCQDIRAVSGKYDFIIANFFLDCFSAKDLGAILSHLKRLIGPNGKLLVTDFYPTNAWHQRLLINSMHRFFRFASRLEADALLDIHERIKEVKLTPIKLEFFRNGSVFSAIYEKLPH